MTNIPSAQSGTTWYIRLYSVTPSGTLGDQIIPADLVLNHSPYDIQALINQLSGTVAADQITLDGFSPTLANITVTGTVTTAALIFSTLLSSVTAFATPSALAATAFKAFASTVSGATLMGFGTTGDVTLKNRAGTTVLSVIANSTTVDVAGLLTVGTSVRVGVSSGFSWNTRSGIESPADGVITLYNNAGNNFTRLTFGGTTVAFPAISRSTTTLAFVLGDGTGTAGITCGALTASGIAQVGGVSGAYFRVDSFSAGTTFAITAGATGNQAGFIGYNAVPTASANAYTAGQADVASIIDFGSNGWDFKNAPAPGVGSALVLTSRFSISSTGAVVSTSTLTNDTDRFLRSTLNSKSWIFGVDSSGNWVVTQNSVGSPISIAHTTMATTLAGALTVNGACQLGTAAGTDVITIGGTGYGAGVASIRLNGLTTAAVTSQVGTLTNAPVAGNPTFWAPMSIAGVVKYFPLW